VIALHGFSFSGKNHRPFNTSKISKPLLRHSQKRKSKSSEQITGESMSTMRYRICHEVEIQLQHMVPYTLQQNRVNEKKNRSLKEMASCMLHAKSFPQRLWVEALNCATYIQNRSPHRSVKDKTPYEAWSGLKPEVTHFHIFGSRAWARIPSEKRKALDPQSTECIFVGYLDGVKGYRLIDISSERLIIERSVQFEESVSHVPHQSHADTFVLPPIRDDEHAHADSSSDESFDSEDSDDLDTESVQLDAESTHAEMQMQSQSRGPSGPRLLFRMQGILLGIQLILGRLYLIWRSLLLHSLPLNRCHLGIFSWFSLQIHSLMARLLEIPFGNLPCRKSTTPSSRTRLGIWFPFLQEGNLSGADGSTGPRVQRMYR
jgi:hypothetical protein